MIGMKPTSNAPYVRLIACQGSVQLATALAALTTHGCQRKTGEIRTHLLVNRLAAPKGQDVEFADCISELAAQYLPWDGVHYLDSVGASKMLESWRQHSPADACAQLRDRLGIETVDELHIGQNITFEHRLLAEAYPTAKRIACGDGIGLNFTKDYYRPDAVAPPKPTWQSWWREVRTWRKTRKAASALPSPLDPMGEVSSNVRYLLLANLFDEVASDFRVIPAATLADVFARFATHPQLLQSEEIERCIAAMNAARRAVVLLSSNFSETKRMEVAGEVQSYCELIQEAAPPNGTAVIIKPHPRDSHEKIRLLQEELQKSYPSVTVLGDPITFYAPFESIVTYFMKRVPDFVNKTTTVCVSSSCLGLEYLYGCRTTMGLGEERVKARFAPRWQPLRLIHERDLVNAVTHVRKLRTGGHNIRQAG